VKGERSSTSPLIYNIIFLDINKFKEFEVTISISSTYLLFDFSGYVDEIETVPAALGLGLILSQNTLTCIGRNTKCVTKEEEKHSVRYHF